MSERKEMSTEMRSLLAAVLCLVVIAGWSLIYKPPQPPQPLAKPVAATTNPVAPAPAVPSTSVPGAGKAAASAAPVTMRAASAESSVVIESDLYRVEISNRGGVVRSWQLKKFTDDHKPPHTLDLVHPEAAQQSGSWPFSLALDDPQQEAAANSALFEITSAGKVPDAGAVLHAPAEVTLSWSDGPPRSHEAAEIQPHLHRRCEDHGDAGWNAAANQPRLVRRFRRRHRVSGGRADADVYQRRRKTQHACGEKSRQARARRRRAPPVAGTFDFAGIEDLYFAAAFLPPFTARGDLAEIPLTVTGWTYPHETTTDGKTETEIVPQMAVGLATPGTLDLPRVRRSQKH